MADQERNKQRKSRFEGLIPSASEGDLHCRRVNFVRRILEGKGIRNIPSIIISGMIVNNVPDESIIKQIELKIKPDWPHLVKAAPEPLLAPPVEPLPVAGQSQVAPAGIYAPPWGYYAYPSNYPGFPVGQPSAVAALAQAPQAPAPLPSVLPEKAPLGEALPAPQAAPAPDSPPKATKLEENQDKNRMWEEFKEFYKNKEIMETKGKEDKAPPPPKKKKESEFLDICGAPKSVEDVASVRSIIEGVLHFYCVTIFKDATDQFLEGLSINDVLPSPRLLPQVFRPHFCKRPPLNSVTFTDLFDFIQSPRPSPLYNKENRILKLFNKTLSAIENGETEIKLEDIASWATGLENIPPTGLDPKPKIDFLHEDQTSAHPTADSCAKTLYLPVKRENEVLDYPGFLKDFVFAVKEAREYSVP